MIEDDYDPPSKRKRMETPQQMDYLNPLLPQLDFQAANNLPLNPNLLHLIDHFRFLNNAVPIQSETPWIPLRPMEDAEPSIFQLRPMQDVCEKGKLNLPLDSRLLDIFLAFLPPDLLREIWNSYNVTHWIYGRGRRAGTLSKGSFNTKLVLTCFAIYIRIIAMQNEEGSKSAASSRSLYQIPTGPSYEVAIPSYEPNDYILPPPQIIVELPPPPPPRESQPVDVAFNREPAVPSESSEPKTNTNLFNSDFTGRPQRAAISEALTHFRDLLVKKTLEKAASKGGPDSIDALATVAAQQEANNKLPGMQIVELMFSRFHLTRNFWPNICSNFRRLVSNPGRCLVGDENLLHFTGNSGFIRIVPTKPDKMGLWFFELVCLLSNDTPFLLYAKLFDSKPYEGQIPVNTVVHEWVDIINEFEAKTTSLASRGLPGSSSLRENHDESQDEISTKSILVFDSYYMDQRCHELLLNAKVPFMATIQPKKFLELAYQFERYRMKVLRAGESALLWNEMTNEIFLHHFDLKTEIGQKYLLSNAFYPREIHHNQSLVDQLYQTGTDQYLIPGLHNYQVDLPLQPNILAQLDLSESILHLLPVPSHMISSLPTISSSSSAMVSRDYNWIPQKEIFDIYKEFFSTCGMFNEQIHAHKYCHKSGGFQKSGEEGLCHKFMMACVLQNTIVAYRYVQAQLHPESKEYHGQIDQKTFRELCMQLSDELFLEAMKVN